MTLLVQTVKHCILRQILIFSCLLLICLCFDSISRKLLVWFTWKATCINGSCKIWVRKLLSTLKPDNPFAIFKCCRESVILPCQRTAQRGGDCHLLFSPEGYIWLFMCDKQLARPLASGVKVVDPLDFLIFSASDHLKIVWAMSVLRDYLLCCQSSHVLYCILILLLLSLLLEVHFAFVDPQRSTF